jgi:hypothetical protein
MSLEFGQLEPETLVGEDGRGLRRSERNVAQVQAWDLRR